MASQAGQVPDGRQADERWKELDRRRRAALLKGAGPEDDQEARTALGYGRRMRDRAWLFALIGAMGAFVVYISIALLMEGETSGRTFLLAAGVAIGVGVGLEGVAKRRGKRLERSSEEALGG